MALRKIDQSDWGAGVFRQRLSPPGGAYDAQNFLIGDDSLLFKRGGSAYKSTSDSAAVIEGIADVYIGGGQCTVYWSETAEDIYALGADDASLVTVSSSGWAWRKYARGAIVGGLLFVPGVKAGGTAELAPFAYGGSRKTSDPALFSIGATNGSTTITGSGTSWLTTVDPGMIVQCVVGPDLGFGGIVRTVTSDTSLELVDGWALSSGAVTGEISRFLDIGLFDPNSTDPVYVAAVGQRLVVAQGKRARYSPRNTPFGGVASTDYIELATSSQIIGADSFGDTGILFSTDGVWAVSNMVLDPVDDYGNVQWQQQQINQDLTLWGDSGIAGWDQQLVIPALDDIYTMSASGAVDSITQWTIRALYRSYVAAGYRPGRAAVSRGHYFLPIVNGTTLVDVLVARLDRPHLMSSRPRIWIMPWTRWAGHAASTAYASRRIVGTGAPALLAAQGKRVLDLTATFDPSAANASDADGTTPACMVETNDFPTGGGLQPATVDRVRVVYELVAGGVTGDNFDRVDGDIGPNWTADPWIDGDDALVVRGHEAISDASNLLGLYRMWLNSTAFTGPPLAVQTTLIARPTTNQNSVTYSVLGFARDPASAGVFAGYEVRYRYEVAADTISIERWDGGSNRVRIYGPTAIPTRIAAGDILGFTIAAGGLLTATVNGTPVASIVDTTYFQDGAPAYAILGLADSVVGASAIAYDDFTVTIGAGIAVSSDQDAGAYTQLTNLGEQNGGTGWGLSDGSLYQWAKVTKKRNQVRFRITQAGACASFILRSIELLVRPGGKV